MMDTAVGVDLCFIDGHCRRGLLIAVGIDL